MEEYKNKIPFGKPARVRNFKIWRSKYQLEAWEPEEEAKKKGRTPRKGKIDIEAINISNLDGSWMTRIPATFEMFTMISAMYESFCDPDPEEQKRGEDYLITVFSNMQWTTSISNGYYHQAVMMIATAYAHPELLRDKKMFKDFGKEWQDLIKQFLAWRAEFDKMMAARAKDVDDKEDQRVAQIMDELEEQGDGKEK